MGRRNPNGYGCVTKLKGNRSRPWVAKVTIYDEEGHAKQSPIGYAESEGKVVLYQRWSEIKLPRLGKSNQQSLRAAFKHCSKYYGVKYRSMKSYQMQDCIDNCGCAYSTQWAIKNLFGHLDRFAFEIDLIDKMYSQMLESYQKILSNNQISETQKEISENEIKKINDTRNAIMIAENLIKNKGFQDLIIFINGDSISIIVKAKELKEEQIAQIQNIISRELKGEIENIHISNKE